MRHRPNASLRLSTLPVVIVAGHQLTLRRELREESYGVELLHAIGKTYQAKAEHYKVSCALDSAGPSNEQGVVLICPARLVPRR